MYQIICFFLFGNFSLNDKTKFLKEITIPNKVFRCLWCLEFIYIFHIKTDELGDHYTLIVPKLDLFIYCYFFLNKFCLEFDIIE